MRREGKPTHGGQRHGETGGTTDTNADLAKTHVPPTKSDMQKLLEYQKAIDALDAALVDEQAHGMT